MINWAACVRCRPLAGGKLIWRKYVIRASGEPGSETWRDETWRDKNNAWQVGGGKRNQTMLSAFGQAAVAIACR
jgi:hypothetical protein